MNHFLIYLLAVALLAEAMEEEVRVVFKLAPQH
jgi:hypothetical protein